MVQGEPQVFPRRVGMNLAGTAQATTGTSGPHRCGDGLVGGKIAHQCAQAFPARVGMSCTGAEGEGEIREYYPNAYSAPNSSSTSLPKLNFVARAVQDMYIVEFI